jgi:hypothetical protein
MTRSSDLEPYGFTYEHEGKQFSFHIVANSREEAEARLQSMRTATCLGRLRSDSPIDGGVSERNHNLPLFWLGYLSPIAARSINESFDR